MALQNFNFPVEFAGGVDTKTDPKKVIPGKLTTLENGVFTKGKKITKRFGYDVLSNEIMGSTSTITSSQGLTSYKDELLLFSANELYSYSEQTESWVDKGAIYPVKNTNETVVRNSYQQSSPDLAINEDIAVYVYEDTHSGGVNMTVTEVDTGVVIQNNVTLNATGVLPRVYAMQNSIFVLYISSGNLLLRILNIQTPNTIGSEITLESDVNASSKFLAVTGYAPILVFAYYSTGNDIKVAYLLSNGSVGSALNGYPGIFTISKVVNNCLSITSYPSTGTIVVAYSNNTDGLCYTALNRDFSVAAPHTVIDSNIVTPALRTSQVFLTDESFTIVYEKATASTKTYDHYVAMRAVVINTSVGSEVILLRSVGLASNIFTVGSGHFVNVVHESTLQSTYFTIDLNGNVGSKMLPTYAGGLPAKSVLPNVIVNAQTSVAYFPALVRTKFITQGNTNFTLTGLSLEKSDFDGEFPFLGNEISDNLLIGGGIVQAYDGATLSEAGFNFYPENVVATVGTAGSMATGTYQYSVIYVWIDRQGQKHRSAPSIGIQAAVTGPTGSVSLAIPTLRVTSKSEVMIEIYRTTANGTVPFLATSVSSPTYNSKTADSVTFVDTHADSFLSGKEILYTNGGVLGNDAPPSASIVDVNKNRALVAGLEDGLLFGYSKQSLPGEGVSFSQVFMSRVDPLGGDITCLKYMDDKIIIFKDSYIFYIIGYGPNDTGAQDDFTPPTLVSSDVGCRFPQSCVLTPMGLMFKSDKGIYLLDRSLRVQYIGADVEAYNSYTVASGTLMDGVNQVRFVTTNGVALVYDYYTGQWSVFTNHGGNGATIWQESTFAYARADGSVYVENQTKFLDGALFYKLKIATSWLKLNGLQGFQRVKKAVLLGDYLSDHKLMVQVAYDYEPYYYGNYLIDATSVLGSTTYGQDGLNYGDDPVYGGSSSGVYQFEIGLTRQKCQAIQFVFEDTAQASPGQSYSLTDLTLLIGLKSGITKLRSSNKVG